MAWRDEALAAARSRQWKEIWRARGDFSEPGLGYPWSWVVARWLDGDAATVESLADSTGAAVELAGFLTALQRFTPEEDVHEHLTARSLPSRDRATRAAIGKAAGAFDPRASTTSPRPRPSRTSPPADPPRPRAFRLSG
ncbi:MULTISPECIES: hypothetical protein [unclassified Streptomyces]|uniref:hypothetical protein n=1 Tax=unclassified Streptomyces TaxID=2593676 RepID=UPI0038231DA0